MSAAAAAFNQLFSTKLAHTETRDKLADYGGTFVRDRLREASYVRKLIPPIPVTRVDLQRSVNHDTLVKIIDIEPQSRAMAMSFQETPQTRIISTDRVECAFFTISSEVFQKTEQELLAYESPVTKIIEENSVKDIEEVEDREFTIHAEAAVQALQIVANGNTSTELSATKIRAGQVVEFSIIKGELARNAPTNDATVRATQMVDLINLFKLLDGNRLQSDVFLITEPDWDDVLSWSMEEFGSQLRTETAVDGYTRNKLLGRRFVRTIKTDILRKGNIYAFTKPEFFARFYILNQTKFYIDKIANVISWQAWEDIGMILANIAAARKLETYSADANPVTNAQSLLANFIPVAQSALGAKNNMVSEGLRFPQISGVY